MLLVSVSAFSADVADKSWVWSGTSNLSWYGGPEISPYGVGGGFWWGTTVGTSPYVNGSDYANITAKPTHYISIKMRMRLSSSAADRFGASAAKLQWITNSDTIFGDDKSVSFKTYGNGNWKIYNIRVGNNSKWTGTIKRLRFYTCSRSGARVEIEYVKVMQDKTGPAFSAEHLFTYDDGQLTNDATPTMILRDYYDLVSGIDRAEFYYRPGWSTSELDWTLAGIDADGSDYYNFTYPAFSDGTYDLGVKLYDKAGNVNSWLDGDDKWIDDLQIDSKISTRIDVDASSVGDSVPKEIFGNNLMWNQWNGKYNAATGKLTDALETNIDKMGLPVLRYPGGCYSDTFYWKKSIGPVASRPVQYANGCNQTLSSGGAAKFGLDEFLGWCESHGVQPMITCRFRWPGAPAAGANGIVLDGADPFGEALADAVDLVEYCNSPNDGSNPNGGTDWAAQRAANGHPLPYNVKLFEIGNEPWGPDPWGSPANIGLDGPSEYSVAFMKYLEGMKAVDPAIKVSATTHLQGQLDFDPASPEWTTIVYELVGTSIDYAQAHLYLPYSAWQTDMIKLYDEVMATPRAMDESLSSQRTTIKRTAPEKSGVIKLRLTEWNINFNWWYDPAQGRINTYHTRTLKSAVSLADAFRVLIGNRDLVDSAEWWHLYSGYWAGINSDDTTPNPVFHSFRIYNKHFGDRLVKSKVIGSPTYDYIQSGGVLKSQYDIPRLSAISSISTDGKNLYLVVINNDRTNTHSSRINLKEFLQAPYNKVKAEVWELNGPNVDDYNNPSSVKMTETSATYDQSFDYTFPAHSVTSFKFTPEAATIERVGDLKKLADDISVRMTGKCVTAVFSPQTFYVEEDDRSSGVRVESITSISPDNRASVSGKTATNTDGERYIAADTVTSAGTGIIRPLMTPLKSFGKSNLYNVGLLVKVCGMVSQIDPQGEYLYINDGSDLFDGTQTDGQDNLGVRVALGASGYQKGQFISLVGISSTQSIGMSIIRQIRPRSPGDVQVLR